MSFTERTFLKKISMIVV